MKTVQDLQQILNKANQQQIFAYVTTYQTYQFEVGGWLNLIQDGEELDKYIPKTLDDAKEYIYWRICEEKPKQVRFATKEFITTIIDFLFELDKDIEQVKQAMNW